MKERPILFNGAMVRAVLDGHKTQTRRVVKWPKTPTWHDWDYEPNVIINPGTWEAWPWAWHRDGAARAIERALRCPYGIPGDRLWVRETFWDHDQGEPPEWDAEARDERVEYRASEWDRVDPFDAGGWRPSIHMPRWASRITLEITDVRVERLQDITAADCRAEGHPVDWSRSKNSQVHDDAARDWYSDLWDSIHGPRGYAWPANPWVWVITFQRLETPHAGRE